MLLNVQRSYSKILFLPAGSCQICNRSIPFQREFEEAKEGLINLDKKYKEATELIGSYVAEADEMRERQEALQQAAAERDSEIGDLRSRLEVSSGPDLVSQNLDLSRNLVRKS